MLKMGQPDAPQIEAGEMLGASMLKSPQTGPRGRGRGGRGRGREGRGH